MKTFLRNALFDVRIWLLLFFLQIPSLRAMFKYLPLAPVLAPVLLFGAFLAYALALHATPLGRRLRRIADNYIISVVILLLCCGLNALIYPYADSLKYQGGGSTADDVLIASIHALLAGKDLYDIPVTASPGPGWILLNAPFTATGLYVFLTPCYLAAAFLLTVRLLGNRIAANLVLMSLGSSLAFWELLVTGHDAIAMSCMIAILFLLTERYCCGRFGLRGALVALLAGIFGTARIIFPFLIPLLGLLIWKHDRRHAILFCLVGLTTTFGLHGIFLLQNQPYDPFHLFSRAGWHMGMGTVVLGTVATLGTGLAAWRRVGTTMRSAMGWFILCLTTPLVFIAFGELRGIGFELARWEGGNYLLPALYSSLVYVFFLSEPARSAGVENTSITHGHQARILP